MKKTGLLISSLYLCGALSAQPGVIETRHANNQDGKILTMEETILSRELSPENLHCTWLNNEEILMFKDSRWQVWNITSDTYSENSHKPESEKIFHKGQSLWMTCSDGSEKLIAESENPEITYGQTVSRNEFGIEGGTFWSPDRSKIAFYRKDESNVTSFPLLDITTRTGTLKEIRYPMAGMGSEVIQLGVFDIASEKVTYMKVNDFGEDRYLTNITWSPDGSKIYIQVLDRSQKHLKLNMYDASTGDLAATILTEDNEKYVEPQDPLYFIKGCSDIFIYRTSNRDGYRNLYLCDNSGDIRRLTVVDSDVAYLGNDGRYIYYTSAEISPVENHLFRIEIRSLKKGVAKMVFGKPQQLTEEPGWHNISLSPDCSHFIDNWSALNVPRVIDLCSGDGKTIRNLLTAQDPTMDYAYTEINLGKVKSADGQYDNYYRLIKPKDFDPSRKYPVILYVYGGPHSQMVQNTYMAQLRRWEMHMAQKGYLVYVQDNRGTQNRGLAFEQAIHRQCGQAEMADQMEGIKMLMSLPYVDKDRIGVHGWSYGGFMTISLITNYPEIFKVAVAGGPVIDWKWYEVMYGERYMDHPDVNPDGYQKTSLIYKAKDLQGKLLICQGAVDPVVVWEHSLSFIRECIKNNVQVDYFPYPCAEHNVMGKDRVHLHDKITMYFEDYLK